MTALPHEVHRPVRADRIQTFRQRFGKAVNDHTPSKAARAWRTSLFERGLRLADEIECRVGSLAGKHVLDVGSAHGGDVAALCARGANCTAADLYDYDYDDLKTQLEADGTLDHSLFDCNDDWPFGNTSYDVVISMAVIEHVHDLGRFFDELLRVLKPGGLALVHTSPALKSMGSDSIFHLPLISLLPNRMRSFIAMRILGRPYEFTLSVNTFYSCRKLTQPFEHLGHQAVPAKFLKSPIIARTARWPMAKLWHWMIRRYAYDFVAITKQQDRSPCEYDLPD